MALKRFQLELVSSRPGTPKISLKKLRGVVRDDSYGPDWLTKASQHEDGYEGGGRGLKDQRIQQKFQENTISAMPLCPIFMYLEMGEI